MRRRPSSSRGPRHAWHDDSPSSTPELVERRRSIAPGDRAGALARSVAWIGSQDELPTVRETRTDGQVAGGADRHRVRCEVRDRRSEQVISDGQDPVCLRVWAAEQAEAPASRGGDANKGTSTVDQGAAKLLELSL